MLRRSLLTAAIAAPALYAAKSIARPIYDMPIEGAVPPGQWEWGYALGNFEYIYNVGLGHAPRPTTYPVTGLDDPLVMARISQQDRNEIQELAGYMAVGEGLGLMAGWGLRGAQGGVIGAVIGVGAGTLVYIVSATGAMLRSMQNQGFTMGAQAMNLDGSQGFLNAWGAGGIGPFGIGYPQGGGSGWNMIPQY